jgi:hypothetical protein
MFLIKIIDQNFIEKLKTFLGADFVYNRDPFAATNNPGTSGLFNEGEENVAKKVGDKIGYIIFPQTRS